MIAAFATGSVKSSQATRAIMKVAAATAPASASHLICWRSSRPARRNLRTSDSGEPTRATRSRSAPNALDQVEQAAVDAVGVHDLRVVLQRAAA